MGIHWYARSSQLLEVLQALEAVERRIFATGASDLEVEAALAEREALYAREDAARTELEHRGRAVTIGAARHWPPDVAQHVEALGPAERDCPLLDLLGWGVYYYAENLRAAGVPMGAFSSHLDSLRLSPEEARVLGEELLTWAAHTARGDTLRHAREAGLWLYLWGTAGCAVEAGQ